MSISIPYPFASEVVSPGSISSDPDDHQAWDSIYKPSTASDNAAWDFAQSTDAATFGLTVRSVAKGRVLSWHDGAPDSSDFGNPPADKGPGGYGNWVTIEHTSQTGEKFYATYMHLKQGSVTAFIDGLSDGKVFEGTPIGQVGQSGWAFGPHLHFQVSDTLTSVRTYEYPAGSGIQVTKVTADATYDHKDLIVWSGEAAVERGNTLPEAMNDTLDVTLRDDGTVVIPIAKLLANDSDADGDKLTFVDLDGDGSGTGWVGNGTAVRVGNNIVFTPDEGATVGRFAYAINDGHTFDSDWAVVELNLKVPNFVSFSTTHAGKDFLDLAAISGILQRSDESLWSFDYQKVNNANAIIVNDVTDTEADPAEVFRISAYGQDIVFSQALELSNGKIFVLTETKSSGTWDSSSYNSSARIYDPSDGTLSEGKAVMDGGTQPEGDWIRTVKNSSAMELDNGNIAVVSLVRLEYRTWSSFTALRDSVFLTILSEDGEEVLQTTRLTPPSQQIGSEVTPQIFDLGEDGFLVSWSQYWGGSQRNFQHFNKDGTPSGNDWFFDEGGEDVTQRFGWSLTLDDGTLVALIKERDYEADSDTYFIGRFSKDGEKLGDFVEVFAPAGWHRSAGENVSQIEPIQLEDGTILFALLVDITDPETGGFAQRVIAQRLDEDGQPIGTTFDLLGVSETNYYGADLMALSGNRFLVTWRGEYGTNKTWSKEFTVTDEAGAVSVVQRLSELSDGSDIATNSYGPEISADGETVSFGSLGTFNSDRSGQIGSDGVPLWIGDTNTGDVEAFKSSDQDFRQLFAEFADYMSDDQVYYLRNDFGDLWLELVENDVGDGAVLLSDNADLGVISADGAFVAYAENGDNIGLYNTATGRRDEISGFTDGHGIVLDDVENPSLSDDGAVIVFENRFTDPDSGLTVRDIVIYHFDIDQAWTLRTTADLGSYGVNDDHEPKISGDGRYVVFTSRDDSLTPGDTNGKADVFVYEIATGKIALVSYASDGSGANGDSFDATISADGSVIAFTSSASNLVENDDNGRTDVFSVNLPDFSSIGQPNTAPTGEVYGAVKSEIGKAVSIDLAPFFSDDDEDPLSFSATGLPAGVTLDPDTGILSGTPTVGIGSYTVTLKVEDGMGGEVTDTFTWKVIEADTNQAPTTKLKKAFSLPFGQAVNIDLNDYFSDPDGDTLTFFGSGLPEGLSLDRVSGVISGTVTAPLGSHPMSLTADDGNGGYKTANFDFDVVQELDTYKQLIRDNGLMLLTAQLANAAYWLAPQEKHGKYNSDTTSSHQSSFDWVTERLRLLTEEELPGVELRDDVAAPDFKTLGFESGIYHVDNAAALVARSDDALFVSFRGTNGKNDANPHWLDRAGHAKLFTPLLEELAEYIEARDGTAQEVTKVFLTGHSLGAGMVQYAFKKLSNLLDTAVEIEGVTFASPGSSGIKMKGSDDLPITNFVNNLDVIQTAHGLSDLWGQTYHFNTISANLKSLFDLSGFSGVLDSHGMGGYLAISQAIAETGFDIGDIRAKYVETPDWVPDWFGVEDRQLRLHVPLQARTVDGETVYYAGEGNDWVMAGAFAAAKAVAKGIGGVFVDLPKPLKAVSEFTKVLSVAKDPTVLGSLEVALSTADTIANPNYLGKFAKKISLIYTIGKTAIDAADAYFRSDLIIGRSGDDYLNGLGGHDIIFGGDDDDHLVGGSGLDELWGGDGNDLLDGGEDKKFQDTLNGGKGDDTYLVYSAKDKTIETSEDGGWDTVIAQTNWTLLPNLEQLVIVDDGPKASLNGYAGTGNANANVIIGGEKGNVLSGLGGDDYIEGGLGSDKMSGGSGKDTFVVRAGHVSVGEEISGGSGTDTLLTVGKVKLFDAVSFKASAKLSSIEIIELAANAGQDKAMAWLTSQQLPHGKTDGLADDLIIRGSSGSQDTLKITMTKTALFLQDFTFETWGLRDLVTIDGTKKSDTIGGSQVRDVISAGNDKDLINGFGGADDLYGGKHADTLKGGAGLDRLDGGKHNDTLKGGAGGDTFVFSKKYGHDTILDFEDDIDTIELDSRLWSHPLNAKSVVTVFAEMTDDGIVFDFGKHTLTLKGFHDLSELADDLVIV